MIKAVIFDLDGVLVDACEWHYLALNKALKEVVDFEISREDHDKIFNGLPTKSKLEILKERGGVFVGRNSSIDEEIKVISDLKQKYTLAIIKANIGMDRPKCAMLSNLVADGIKVACVTNSIKETTSAMLQGTYIQRYLSIIITNEDVILPKGHPNGYWNAMSLLGVLPEETLIVEDSVKGLEAAYAAGANVWEVSGPDEVTWRNLAKQLDLCEES